LQETRQYAPEAACIQHEPCLNAILRAGFIGDVERWSFTRLDGIHGMAEANVGALLRRTADQQIVERGALDLIGRPPAWRVLVAEIV
jgi:hypothetical protein